MKKLNKLAFLQGGPLNRTAQPSPGESPIKLIKIPVEVIVKFEEDNPTTKTVNAFYRFESESDKYYEYVYQGDNNNGLKYTPMIPIGEGVDNRDEFFFNLESFQESIRLRMAEFDKALDRLENFQRKKRN